MKIVSPMLAALMIGSVGLLPRLSAAGLTSASRLGRSEGPKASAAKRGDGRRQRAERGRAGTGGRAKVSFKRVAHARVYQQKHWTLPGGDRDARYVGEALAKLRPTYVSGLVRLETPSGNPEDYAKLAKDYDQIRRIVLRAEPGAKFDIVLNMKEKQYPDRRRILDAMSFLDKLFQPDGWYFDFLDNGRSDVIAEAVEYAHGHKQFIGGNINGGGAKVPRGIDLVGITDGTSIKKHIGKLRGGGYKGPILVHIENNPQHASDVNAGGQFVEGGAAQRKDHVKELARGKGYTVMFPVFYPLYPHATRRFESYDAVRDGGMLATIKKLMGAR